ncbi:MAG: hypothetical protein HUU46_21245 [Candidatus Hydrogenedentes bacterium]|nr:hypothetical protein [Candidatus Hydrogenedentota bacterium]
MRSKFFYDGHYRDISARIKDYINGAPDFLSAHTSGSTRAVGDAIERIISDRFDALLGEWCRDYSARFARRAMADVAFTDKDGFYCVVDVKTHREDTKFNMPNLTSVERLARFYEDDTNVFTLLMVKYRIDRATVIVSEVLFVPIEFLDWDCLTLGNLGWGQIQIANSNRIHLNHAYSRRAWMLSLCDALLEFYPKEIAKVNERIGHFHTIKSYWEEKADVWSPES